MIFFNENNGKISNFNPRILNQQSVQFVLKKKSIGQHLKYSIDSLRNSRYTYQKSY